MVAETLTINGEDFLSSFATVLFPTPPGPESTTSLPRVTDVNEGNSRRIISICSRPKPCKRLVAEIFSFSSKAAPRIFPTPLLDSNSSSTRILAITSSLLASSRTWEIVISPVRTFSFTAARRCLDSFALASAAARASGVRVGGSAMRVIYFKISSAIDRARAVIAVAPSFHALVIGRPMTSSDAPAAIASRGVITLF